MRVEFRLALGACLGLLVGLELPWGVGAWAGHRVLSYPPSAGASVGYKSALGSTAGGAEGGGGGDKPQGEVVPRHWLKSSLRRKAALAATAQNSPREQNRGLVGRFRRRQVGGEEEKKSREKGWGDANAEDGEESSPNKRSNIFLKRVPPRKIALMIEPTPFTHVSGYANRFRYLLQNLAKAGDSVHIVTTDDKKEAPRRFLRFPIINTTGFRFPLYNHICLTFDHDFKGWGLLKRMRPEILHVTSPGFIPFAALLYARVFRVPLVFSYHTHLPMYAKTYAGWIPGVDWISFKMIKMVHNRADLTLVTSPQMRDELESWGIERVDVWRKGIDTDKFNPTFKSEKMRQRLSDGNPEAPLLIYVGRMGAEKRLRDIRDVMDRLPGARAALVGGGPDLAALKDYFRGYNVVFTGPLSGEELSQAFASADIFMMPSDTETLGFVVLESMASGVPVIASRAGGIPDLIEDGVTGFLCEPGNADSFAERARQLLDDPALFEKLRLAAREETEKHSWEAATAYLRNVQYQKAIVNYKFRALDGLGLPHTRSKLRGILQRGRDFALVCAKKVAPFLPACNVAGETPYPVTCGPLW